MSAAVLGACEAPRFLVGGHHSGSLGGRPNRRGSADPITHRCRELVGGSARLRSARVAPFPSVGTVPLVHALAAFRFLHYQALRNALLREDVPGRKTNAGRVHLPVLFRREVRFVSGGGGCWFAIHSACSASLSHSRTSSSKPALRVGSRVSCPRCSARLACSLPLRSRPHANRTSKNQSGSRNEPDSGRVISVDLGFPPAPHTFVSFG
jgi:hypothetical protein